MDARADRETALILLVHFGACLDVEGDVLDADAVVAMLAAVGGTQPR
jgi:hypothetical protein